MRVGGAQALSRAGFDAWTIALLARWGSIAVFGYIREAPLNQTASMAPRAFQLWEHPGDRSSWEASAGDARSRSPRGAVAGARHRRTPPAVRASREAHGPDHDEVAEMATRLFTVEARISALEAATWAKYSAAESSGREFQRKADAAAQTLYESSESATQTETPGPASAPNLPLAHNHDSSRVGTQGRFTSTHLVVPTSLQAPGEEPRAFCARAFSTCAHTVARGDNILVGEVRESASPAWREK